MDFIFTASILTMLGVEVEFLDRRPVGTTMRGTHEHVT
jgi:hypothetical protein